jgi:formylglycine-generating enzyme required for sulfatase activity
MLTTAIDTTAAAAWYRRNRARSEALFDLIDPAAYYSRPILLRNPIVFYEGHLPAFSVIAFLRRGLGRPPVDARLEQLFERGIDPDSEASAVPRSGASTVWPSRDEVRAFARACDEAILEAMQSLSSAALPLEGLYTALEHEAMHQETLLYMWHRLPYAQKRAPRAPGSGLETPAGPGSGLETFAGARSRNDRGGQTPGTTVPDLTPRLISRPDPGVVAVAAGPAVLGAVRSDVAFGWDNEFDQHTVHVSEFEIDTLPVTNAQFLAFMNAGGYTKRALWSDEGWEWIQTERVSHPAFWLRLDTSAIGHRQSAIDHRSSAVGSGWLWRGMFEAAPLPADFPVYVSHAEASAYAKWQGRRLMTEAEWHRAAEGASAGHHDFAGFDPEPVGSHPGTASTWGVHELIGNGWEWTSTVFAPFAGFAPMRSYPEYSADFFDGRHYVMKGASPATAAELVRPSFRNWFRANYPYVYAKFRTARS